MTESGSVADASDRFGPLALRLNPRVIGLAAPFLPGARGAGGPPPVVVEVDADGCRETAGDEAALFDLAAPPFARTAAGGLRFVLTEEALRRATGEGAEASRSTAIARCLRAARESTRAPLPRPRLVGIVNATPDSFSDGGRFLSPAAAVDHALRLVDEGAEIVDVGGESTRPGAPPVSLADELERVLPVVEGLTKRSSVHVSIDTTKAEVARRAVEAGARTVNDVSAGTADPEMLISIARLGVDAVLMHRSAGPAEMQLDPRYQDPVAEISGYLRERVAAAIAAGVDPTRIAVDPGIGFGKALEHNLALIQRLSELRSLGLPLYLGVSRKSFIGHATGRLAPQDWQGAEAQDRPSDRIGGTAAAVAACVRGGAEFLRVHDVRIMAEAAWIAAAVRDAETPLATPTDAPSS